MVEAALSVGALVGVLLSGGFVWWEVGRFATPQVPATLFDERRELFAYTAGLFVGVPIALIALLCVDSFSNGALLGAFLFLALLVGATEVAQWALLRTRFWGTGESRPFYALGYRAAIGGIISLTLVAQYLGGPSLSVEGVVLVLLQSAAFLSLQVAGALLSVPARPSSQRTGGGPVSGALVQGVGFLLIGFGILGGEVAAIAGAFLATVGGAYVYRRVRSILATVPPPTAPPPKASTERPASYGRTGGNEPLPPGR
jgi:hypothetical protein